MKKVKVIFITFLILNGFLTESESQIFIGNTEVDTNTIASNLDTPWEIIWGPDDMIWITERKGLVSRIDPESGHKEVLLDIIEIVDEGIENGLLGMALHPNFEHPDSQFVYLVYTIYTQARSERLVRYTFDTDTLIDEVILLDGIHSILYHAGSRLQILPDRTILMTTGDAGSSGVSQDTSALAGKILRINPDGSVPDDNPIPGNYLWSLGHRNAQGLVLASNGILYSSEHGPANDDEINIIEKGRNYGWPDVQGFCDLEYEQTYCTAHNIKEPIYAWTPTLAVCGLDYYDHDAIPEWKNSLLLATLKARRIVAMKLSQDGRSVLQEEQFFKEWWGRLRDICISPDGRVFIGVSNGDGRGTEPGDDRIIEIAALNVQEYCSSEQFATICPGETYNFYGLEINLPGTYIDTIFSESGCDTIISLQLDASEGYDFEADSIVVEESVMMTLNDTLTLTALEGFISYKWNNDLPSPNNTITIIANELGEGNYLYTVDVEDADGCIFARYSNINYYIRCWHQ